MSSTNKFGFGPIETPKSSEPRTRSVGPMGAAVRDAAENLQETTEAKVEQRRQNAEDAKAFRSAREEGRVLLLVALPEVQTSDLPRDRLELDAVASSVEMEELKASIRERGQKEPVELYRDGAGGLQLKKGWRRFTALSQLFAETGDDRFSKIVARIEESSVDRLGRYIDMVEENVVREDLTFAEMAQVAILAAQDAETDEVDPDAMVSRLYGSLHKMKRSYIRSFVFLLCALGDDLKWPKSVARNLGVEVARSLKTSADTDALRVQLSACQDAEHQSKVLSAFLTRGQGAEKPARPTQSKEKREFHVGDMKVTARKGECRIVGETDFAGISKDRLEQAVEMFQKVLREGNPRVTGL